MRRLSLFALFVLCAHASLLESERKVRSLASPHEIGEYIRVMSAEPHDAGSPGSKKVAEYAVGLLKSWGLEAQIEEFRALLPKPKLRILEMVAPSGFKASLSEPALAADPDTRHQGQIPTFNAYSPSGDVTAELVYANYGMPEDYAWLQSRGISVKGKIVLTRYGGGWRGLKPKIAAMHGAAGCIIYSDPRDDGYFAGDVYPKGPYRPAGGAQRGSVMQMELYPGDPLSPGWPDQDGAKRLPLSEARNLAAIPVLPVSWPDAEPLLKSLGGPVPPESWRGALPLTYHAGPGPAKVRLAVDFDWSVLPVYDVIATIPGSTWPDQWVLYGNHHDAWVNGAQDPVSGAAVVLETARAFADMRRQGWQPQRTMIFALWDAEEYGLVGSTEWVEKHADELSRKAVAYLNTDSYGRGPATASGSHTLERFIESVFRDVTDPDSKKSVFERSVERAPRREFHLGPAGAGSDYVAFLDRIGVASINIGSGSSASSGGVYHSIYDSYEWFTRFGDPGFEYGRTLAQIMSTAMLRLADAPVLPFEFASFARTVRGYAGEIAKLAAERKGRVDLKPVLREAAALERIKAPSSNERLFLSERALLGPGLPGRPWYRHEIYAPGWMTGYAAKTLPGIREAVENGRWDEAAEQVNSVAAALHRLRAELAGQSPSPHAR